MASPAKEAPRFEFNVHNTARSSDEETTVAANNVRPEHSVDPHGLRDRLQVEVTKSASDSFVEPRPSPSKTREEASRLNDELAMQRAEKMATIESEGERESRGSTTLQRSRSRKPEPTDDFDTATNPLHERTNVYRPPEHPTTKVAKFFKYIHESSFLVRWFTYIVPVTALLLIPVLIGALTDPGQNANVGSVELLWFGVWLEIVWLTLWGGRLLAKLIPVPLGLVSSLFTNNSKKWRDLGKQLEVPATIFFWCLAIEVSFLPTMTNHHIGGIKATKHWEETMNKVLIAILVGAVLNFIEKIIIQLIAISFHLRTYQDRIEINKFQIGSLTKLYTYSREKIEVEDAEFEEKPSDQASGARTPAIYAQQATVAVNKAFAKVGDVAGAVAGDFTGRKVAKSSHPSQVILALLNSTGGSQVLARRLYRTFVQEGRDTVYVDDLKNAFDNADEADAAFSMFDKDMNGDISMEELEAVCVEIGRERKSITASLKDLDSVVSKLDDVLFFIVLVVAVLVLISLISTSAAGVLTSAGSAVLALSWLFAATAQEFLQSCIFVFVKHPFDVGDRVSIYGNTGAQLKGDDYFVKEISLLYTEFKKMEGQIVQAPNSYLNTLFILNMRRSGGLAEAVPVVIRFGTTLDQIEGLQNALLEFVRAEKREYQDKVLTELRDVTEVYSLTLNIVFFYKSNWQNELLRLQRRNKFICAMMMAMSEQGIEGPYRNLAGFRQETPYYVQAPHGAPPLYSSAPPDANNRPPAEPASVDPAPQTHPSILRRRNPSTGQLGRTRTESLSAMAKRVDFSLGMKNISSGDQFGDLFEEQSRDRYASVIREANREEEERKAAEGEAESARSTSRGQRSGSVTSPRMTGGIFRRSTEQSGSRRQHDSVSSGGTHRNRFVDRFGRSGRSTDLPRDSLAEEGRSGPLDPRTGQVSSEAYRMDSTGSAFPPLPEQAPSVPPVPSTSNTRDFGLTRLPSQPSNAKQL